jgi:hypothetical protein
MSEPSPFHDAVVGLDASEASLVVHLLVTFERLLRQGGLDDAQLRLLVPPGSGAPGPSGDVEMANAVADILGLLERQLR